MTSSNNFSKFLTFGTSAILAFGFSLVAVEPAHAATSITWDAGAGATMDANGQQTYTESVTSVPSAPGATKAGCTVSQWAQYSGGILFSYVSFPYTPYGATLDIRPIWACPNTLNTAPTATISGNNAVATVGSWATTPDAGDWRICGMSVNAGSSVNNGYFNAMASGCEFLYTSNVGFSRATNPTLSLSGTYYRPGNQVATLAGSTLVWVEYGGGSGGTPAYFANTASVSVPMVQQSSGTVTANPATPVLSNGVITSTAGSWQNTSGNFRGYWLVCGSSYPAANGNQSAPRPADCGPISATALSGQSATWIATNPFTIPASFNKWVSCTVNGCTTSVVSASNAHMTWYEWDNGTWTMSATVALDGSSTVVSAPVLTAEQARSVLKPVPAAVQPLVPAFIALNKPMASLGGKVALSSGDFTGLVSAKIAGKSLDFILGNTGKITMTVPQGEAGKTADLVLTFNTGSIILQDAIKYVAPLDVAKVGERPIAIAAGSKKITAGAADQIRQAALANVKNDTIQCIAYSASNSAAAKAAAQLTAVQACGVAVKANSDLKVADVVVIVDKLKARTQGVGIKVYKADN